MILYYSTKRGPKDFIICQSDRVGHVKHRITILSITHDALSWKKVKNNMLKKI